MNKRRLKGSLRNGAESNDPAMATASVKTVRGQPRMCVGGRNARAKGGETGSRDHWPGRYATGRGQADCSRSAFHPTGPKRRKGRNLEAGRMTAPDPMPKHAERTACFMGASTPVPRAALVSQRDGLRVHGGGSSGGFGGAFAMAVGVTVREARGATPSILQAWIGAA